MRCEKRWLDVSRPTHGNDMNSERSDDTAVLTRRADYRLVMLLRTRYRRPGAGVRPFLRAFRVESKREKDGRGRRSSAPC